MASSTRILLLVVAAIQLVLWLLVLPQALELTRQGDLSVSSVAACVLSALSLVVACVLVLTRQQAALWLYLAGALIALGAGSPPIGPAPEVAVGVSLLSALLVWRSPLRSGTVA